MVTKIVLFNPKVLGEAFDFFFSKNKVKQSLNNNSSNNDNSGMFFLLFPTPFFPEKPSTAPFF